MHNFISYFGRNYAQNYCLLDTKQNGEFVSRIYKLNAPLPLTHSGEGYPRFSLPAYVENICFDGFFLTESQIENILDIIS
jgi:hypothetical protein